MATAICPRHAHAQAGLPDSLKATIDGTVQCVTLQSDGKILIGGTFANVGGVARGCIARLNADGTLDTTFDPGTGATGGYSNQVAAIAVQADGYILVGGDFSSYNGNTNYHNLIRVDPSGNLDTTYLQNSGLNIYYGIVYGIALQSDGRAIVGGSNNINGGTRLVRLNTDGSLDTTFDPGTGPNSIVYCLALQSDGKIVIGGDFTTYAGAAANYFARVNTDGSLDTSFSTSVGASSDVKAVAIQSDGSIVLGGYFNTVNGVTTPLVARVYDDASSDPTFVSEFAYSAAVSTLAIQADGKILVGGSFNYYNGVAANGIVRLNTDASRDTTFQPGVGANGAVDEILLQSDGKAFAVGTFTTFDGLTRDYLARLNSDTSSGGVFNFSAATYTADQANGSLTVSVTRTLGQTGAASVNATTANGTATSGTDYTYTRVTLNWADGDTAPKTFSVPLLLSDPAATTKTFTIGLSGATDAVLGQTAPTTTVTLMLEGAAYTPPPTPTPSPSPTPTPTSTPSPTPTPTITPTPTPTPPGTPTPTPTPTITPTPTPPGTPTPIPSGTPTPTPSGTVSPTPTPVLPIQPTLAITSPPDGITVVVGADLPLAASVTDPDGVLAQVQFFLDGTAVGTGTAAPFVFDSTAPTSVGNHTVQAVATDTLGRTTTASVTLGVTAVTGTAAPTASVVTPIDGRSFVAGSTLSLSITAASAASTSLDHVSLYANGVLIGTFVPGDSSAQSVPAGQPARRDAAVAASNVFQTTYTLPAANTIINMIAVALDKLGQSGVSHIATIQSVVTGDQPPSVALSGLSNGAHVSVGSNSAVTVTVTPATGSVPSAARRKVRQDASSAGTLALLEYYLNGSKLSEATTPPYSFTFTPPSTGKYVLDAVATDSTGISSISEPVTVQADVAPTVNLAIGGSGAAVEGGANGIIVVTRTGDTSQALTVSYKAKGAAVAGVDYKKLPGSVTIPAGAVKAKIKVKPIDGSPNASTLKIKVQLLPSVDGSYVIGASPVKLKLIGD